MVTYFRSPSIIELTELKSGKLYREQPHALQKLESTGFCRWQSGHSVSKLVSLRSKSSLAISDLQSA
jgi:hypothetical protein